MLKEIGGDFWLNPYKPIPSKDLDLSFLGITHVDSAFLSSGRSAISYVLDHVGTEDTNKKALLPSFTCFSVVEPFIKSGYQVEYYYINCDLFCRLEHLTEQLQKYNPTVLLLQGYFGFNTLADIGEVIVRAMDRGVVVINDVTHTFYSQYGHLPADFYIASLRKWGPLPDGGFALSTEVRFRNKPSRMDPKLKEAKLTAFYTKCLYIDENRGDKAIFREHYKVAEKILNEQKGFYAITNTSYKIQANMNLNFLRQQRRSNFKTLLKIATVAEVISPIFRVLPLDVTPLYFPIYVEERLLFQQYMAKHDIYCPIVWPKHTYCADYPDEKINWIYDHILAIPCDQRYDEGDMKRIGEVILCFGQ